MRFDSRLAIGLALFCLRWSPSATAAGIVDQYVTVASVSCEGDAKNNQVVIELLNVSQQTITAYTVTATIALPGGKTESGAVTKDLVIGAVNERLGAPAGDLFGPGQRTRAVIHIPHGGAGNVSPATSVVVNMLAFQDRTAIGEDAYISLLKTSRQNDADEAADIIDDLKQVEAASDVASALKELDQEAERKSVAATPRDRSRARRRAQMLHMLRSPMTEHPDQIPPYRKAMEVRLAVLLEHAKLVQGEK